MAEAVIAPLPLPFEASTLKKLFSSVSSTVNQLQMAVGFVTIFGGRNDLVKFDFSIVFRQLVTQYRQQLYHFCLSFLVSNWTATMELLERLDELATTVAVPKSALLIIAAIISTAVLHALRRASRSHAFTNAALRALRLGGPIPEHVAFIMDGNRRWARGFGLPPSSGHPRGGEKLLESLQWCLEAGVQTVTVFAFSIENFKRSSAEVDELMCLAERTLDKFSNKRHVIHERRVRVRVLGDLNLIAPCLRGVFARVMKETCDYTDGPTLNICFAYASRYDIGSAVRDVAGLCRRGAVHVDDVDEDVIAACLASGLGKGGKQGCKLHPDLLVRTSGETRLSDFLLWEAANCVISFYAVLWPDFSAWDFVKILLDYQHVCSVRNTHYTKLLPDEHVAFTPGRPTTGYQRAAGQRRDVVEDAIKHVRHEYFRMIDKFALVGRGVNTKKL